MASNFTPDREHIRHCLIFLFHSQVKAAEAHRQLQQAYGEDAPSYHTCQLWFQRFKEGDYSISDNARTGRPLEVDLDTLLALVKSDPFDTTRGYADMLAVSHVTVATGLARLGLVQKLGRWIPHELSDFDKARRRDTCTSLISINNNHPFLANLITGDEKWVMYSNVTRKPQWVDKAEQPQPVPKPDPHGKKILLSCWWSRHGMEYWELLPPGVTITAPVYCDQLRKLKAKLERRRGQQAKIVFLHDNARPHVARDTQREIASYGWMVLPHPPYSPDIAPSDYHLFSALQRFLDGQTFSDEAELKSALTRFFKSQPPSFWEQGIDALPDRWQQVVDADGAYF